MGGRPLGTVIGRRLGDPGEDPLWALPGMRRRVVRVRDENIARSNPPALEGRRRGRLLSGVASFALVDYCMGSTLWAHTNEGERIATINISINYVQTATEGDIVCRTTLDRRNRRTAVMRSEVRHEDGRLLATAIGSYTIFAPRGSAAPAQSPPAPAP